MSQPDSARVEDYVNLDVQRTARRGYPEAVLCEPKSIAQIKHIAQQIANSGTATLFTRVAPEQRETLREILPGAAFYDDARLVAWPSEPPTPKGGHVLVLSAGTSDVPVALEAHLTAKYLGRASETIFDVGVAGLHRVLRRLEDLRRADVIVVAAGMDGALPSVVAGLVEVPVIALPTSVGYGAAFAGLGPLLSMLNSCAPGVAVVNIDNGYGAGHLAAQIAANVQQVATSMEKQGESGSI